MRVSSVPQQASHRYSCQSLYGLWSATGKGKEFQSQNLIQPLVRPKRACKRSLKGMVFRVLRLKTGYIILLFGVSDVLKELESWG